MSCVDVIAGVFREVHRVLRDDGTLWLGLGDCYVSDSAKGSTGATSTVTNPRRHDLVGYPGRAATSPGAGAGTVGVVCSRLGRDFVGIELNEEYAALASRRIADAPMDLFAAGGGA